MDALFRFLCYSGTNCGLLFNCDAGQYCCEEAITSVKYCTSSYLDGSCAYIFSENLIGLRWDSVCKRVCERIIIMAYAVVRDDRHGSAHNPPGMIIRPFLFLFQWQTSLFLVPGEFSHEVSVMLNAFKLRFNMSRKRGLGRPVGQGELGSSL